jgi:hypothetical protein
MFTIIFCWIAVSAAIVFVGRLFLHGAEWYEYFWVGLVAVLAILQIWSIFLPVNIYALGAVIILGLSSVIVFRKIKIPQFETIKDWIVKNKIYILISCLTILIVSYYASQPVGWDDTLLYHLNAVKWANLYSVVPGLANLHSRLGFNSSFFLFASMLDNLFMAARSSHLALSTLAIVLSIEYIWILVKSKERHLKLFCLFTTPIIFFSIAKQEVIASLSPDFALLLLVLAASIEFLKKGKYSISVAVLLSILLITVKFSAVSFSAIMLLFIFLENRKSWKWILWSGVILIIPYLIRNIYLTGWLFYPLPLFKFSVNWAVPEGQVKILYTVIQTWARVPGTEWSKFVNASFWEWFPDWFRRNQGSAELRIFAFASILVFISLPIKIIDRKFIDINKKVIRLGTISLISILYVFITAPDIRFGAVFIWIFFASVVSLYFSILKWSVNVKIFAVLSSCLLVFFTSWPIRLENKPILKSVRWETAWPTKNVNGILVPLEHSLCGNSDLPCTPEMNNIREIVPGDISKGFASID